MKKENTKLSAELYREMHRWPFPKFGLQSSIAILVIKKRKPNNYLQKRAVKSRKKSEETGVAFGVGPDTYVFILSRYFGELSLLRNGEFSWFIGKSLGRFGKKQVDYAKRLVQCQEQRR